MNDTIVTLKKGEGRTIKSGGLWIFDNEIDTITGSFKNGEIVNVRDFDGYPMGRGYINQNSKIRIRLMTRHIDQPIDEEFLRMRVQNAWDYRKTTVDTSSCRIIFGDADFLPGLVVDKYEDVLVVQCLALGMEAFKLTIVQLLKEILQADGIQIRGVYSTGAYCRYLYLNCLSARCCNEFSLGSTYFNQVYEDNRW
jgi:23S rRNA (cytosine1962-C5)-methyltransferase